MIQFSISSFKSTWKLSKRTGSKYDCKCRNGRLDFQRKVTSKFEENQLTENV